PMRGGSREAFRAIGFRGNLQLLKDSVVGDLRTLWVLMGTIGLVLLIACANVANLFLVRIDERRGELAIRLALGAGGTHLARQLLAESVIFGLAAGTFGLAVAYGGLRLLTSIAPVGLPRTEEIGIDATTLSFTLGVSLLSGLLLGLVPVLRCAGARLADVLHGGGGMSATKESHRLRGALIVAEVAMALVLLIASSLML